MISFKNIEIKYDDFVAMKNLNLEVKEGEFFSFLGPSGSGKTTVLRALTGLVKPSSGNIYILDEDITKKPIEKREIGIVFQSYALFPTMNVYENIAYGLKVRKTPKAEIKKIIYSIIEKIDLSEDQLYKKVSELSGGQQQRVAIARALVIKPKILCLDEPLSNLDAKLRHKLRKELKNLQREFGITTIYVTHDQEEALTLSDRIAVFDNGNLQQVGTPDEIYNNPKTEFVANFIGDVNKITPDRFLSMIDMDIDIDKKYDVYFLINDIVLEKDKDYLQINGKIKDVEYFGYYIKYTLETNQGVSISFIVFMSANKVKIFEVNEEISVYLNPKNIKQYPTK
ncbi:ABC transporter ATP-binding protein [Mycoplasmatota bacterium WC30]